ncbi:MAG: DMT family transporter [Solirubrobacterales bacterium]|nr:DMT family transporter [Solirubrobacterales bacterium]
MTGRSWASMAFTAALWGASYMFIKVALDDGVSEGVIICLRTALGAMVLVPLALRAGALRPILERGWWNVALAGAQVIVPFGLITFGENHIASGLAAILVATAPLFVACIAPFVDRDERSTGWSLGGVLLGMVGIVLLFGVDLSGDTDELLGGLMVLGAGASYAVAVLVVKRGFTGVPPVGVAASTMVLSSLAYLPLALATLPSAMPEADTWASLVVLGAGGTGVAFLFFYNLIADVGPARASIIAYIAPAFSVAYGALLLDEAVTLGVVLGLVLVLAGSWLAAQGRLPGQVSRTAPSRSTAPEPARAR